MSYVVLARKWRPKSLDDVVGQETVTRTLRNAIASGRLGHAFLLTGARGVGKTSTARILARALNCSKTEAPNPDPCGQCASCVEVAAGTSIDVQEIDGATNNTVENVRGLRESAQFNPARDRFRIWIIDEVHMLSASAFNALLKTLEEPPPRVKFILATTEMRKLPETILSRCQIHAFRLLPAKTLVAHLRQIATAEKIEISDPALMRIAQAAEGSVRDGLSLFDQVLAFSGSRVDDKDVVELLGLIDRDLIMRATSAVIENDSLDALALVEALATYGADYRQFARDLLLYWRELLVLKIAPESEISGLLPDDRRRALVHTAALSEEDLLRICDLLARAEIDLRNSLDPRVALELTLLKAAQLRRLLPFSDLVARVEALAAGRPDPRTLSRSTRQESPPRQPPAAPVSPSVVALRGATGLSFAPDADAPSLSSSPAPAHAHAHVKDPLDRLRQAASGRALLTTVLARATAEVDGSLVSLRVPSEVEAAARGQVASLEALAQATLGSETRIRIVSDAPASGAAALSGDADPPRPPLASPVPETSTRPRASRVSKAARDELMKKAADDPGVQQVALTFGGSLTDVRPLERTTPEAPGSEEERNGPESVDEPGRDTRGAGRV